MPAGSLEISIAIPTLDRGEVLVDTLDMLLAQEPVGEILVVDQTAAQPAKINDRLSEWDETGAIRWIRLPQPSIPNAMNVALRAAAFPVVLFLDDDIVPAEGLAAAHLANYRDPEIVAVVGQVIQPWQEPTDIPRPKARGGLWEDLDFPFHSTRRAFVRNCIACNLSVRKEAAISAGGFDERFIGAAYRFETEFCRRLDRTEGKVVFDPEASIRHLKVSSGGVRVYGDGVRRSTVEHSVGDYYYCLSESRGLEAVRFMSYNLFRNGVSRYYLTHPWRLPGYFICHMKSFQMARLLIRERNAKGEFGVK